MLFHQKKHEISVIIDGKKCLKCGYCRKICPPVFEWAAQSKNAKTMHVGEIAYKCLQHAAGGCPVAAIEIKNAG